MARIVLGLGTSHSPQLTVPWDQWSVLQEKDRTDRRMDYQALVERARPGLDAELTPEVWSRRYEACHDAIAVLRRVLAEASPDLVVVLGDDQHEQFHDDNMPMFAVFRGASMPIRERTGAGVPFWHAYEKPEHAPLPSEYPGAPDFAEHLIGSLVREGFDISCSNKLRDDVGLGHAFTIMCQRVRLLSDGMAPIPLVPVMLNTFFKPNQPTPARCYSLGRALRRAVESWGEDRSVAVIASGGLSHVIIDEDLDRRTIRALQAGDGEALSSLPEERLELGSSEIRNWIAAGGALSGMEMSLAAYEPCYRSLAGTGCGMAFAYWR